jgi:hypothetical protein
VLSLFNAPLVANLPPTTFAVATGHFRGANAPLDAATASFRDGTLSVLLGNGDGSFQSARTIGLGASAFINSVAVGDLGNGHDDIVVGNGNGTVEVLRGNGDGTFQSPQAIQVGSAGGVALGDFLGNGRQDIVTYTANGIVNLLPNNGNGTFGSPITTQTGVGLGQVTVGDFFRNGHFGLAFTTSTIPISVFDSGTPTGVLVLRTNNDGTFQNAGGFLAGFGTDSLAVGDFAGHGRIDLATGDRGAVVFGFGTVSVLLNQEGQPAPTTTSLTADGTPSGSVTFFDGSTALGTATLDANGQATLSTAFTDAGDHAITAVYSGDEGSASSSSGPVALTVSQAVTATTLTADLSPADASVVLTAEVTVPGQDKGTPSGTVTFFDGSTALGTATLDANGRAVLTVTGVAVGDVVTAAYNGDASCQASTSDSFTVV